MTFPVAWPSAFSWVFQIGGVFTVMGQHWINVKCLYPSLTEGEVFYRTRFVWALLPLFICSACTFAWVAIDRFRPGLVPAISRKQRHDDALSSGEENNTITTIAVAEEDASSSSAATTTTTTPKRDVRPAVRTSIVALLHVVWPGLCSETFTICLPPFCGSGGGRDFPSPRRSGRRVL